MLGSDTIKLVFVYALAAVVVIGGGLMLYSSRAEANSDFSLLIAGFVGSALTFVFSQESATRATRSFEKGLNTPTPPV